jgi:hypothetical protein
MWSDHLKTTTKQKHNNFAIRIQWGWTEKSVDLPNLCWLSFAIGRRKIVVWPKKKNYWCVGKWTWGILLPKFGFIHVGIVFFGGGQNKSHQMPGGKMAIANDGIVALFTEKYL